MTSYFSLFVLMLAITIGMNVLAAAFITSPAFNELGTQQERQVLFGRIGTEIPADLQGAFNSSQNINTVECATDSTGLLNEVCNPTQQNIQTTSTLVGNITTTTRTIDTTQDAKFGQLAQDIDDTSIISINTFDLVIGALTGEFILRAVAGAFFGFCTETNDPSCDPNSQLPQIFVDGFAVIVLLMFVGMVLSLLFGRSLATAG